MEPSDGTPFESIEGGWTTHLLAAVINVNEHPHGEPLRPAVGRAGHGHSVQGYCLASGLSMCLQRGGRAGCGPDRPPGTGREMPIGGVRMDGMLEARVFEHGVGKSGAECVTHGIRNRVDRS